MKKFLSVLFVVLMSLPAMARTAAMLQEEVAVGDGSVVRGGTALEAGSALGKASADEASDVSGSCGEKVTWKYDTASKTLTVSGEGDMTNYETPDDLPWAAYMRQIMTVVIGEDIKSLSDYAFYWSSALVNVIVEARTPPLCGSFAFYSIGLDATLTVPHGKKGEYEKEFGWKNFGKNIQEKALETSGSCGENATWTYDAATKTLAITGTGEMKNYKEAGDAHWAIYASEIENIFISDGITSICDNAFPLFSSLVSVRMPNSLESIGKGAFESCNKLTSIVIPQNVKSIEDYAFLSCRNLESINVLAVSPPTLGYHAFNRISRYAKFTVPEESLALYQKKERWSILLPSSYCGENATWAYDAATKTLTIMGTGRMYNYESSAPWDRNMDDISKIVIGEGITHIGNTSFTFCAKVTSVTLPSTLESIGVDAFSCCDVLTSVTIPANVTEIKEHAFDDCSALATVTVEAVKPPVLGREVFRYIASNAKFIVPAGSEAAYKADKNWQQYFKGETGISSIDAAKGKAEVKKVFRNGRLCIGNYTIAGQRVQ